MFKGQGGFWGAIGAVVLLALIATLVRPGSAAPNLASSIGQGASGVLSAAENG